MIWLQCMRTKWRTSVGNLLGAEYPRRLVGYPSQLFDGHAHSSPVNESEEDEFVSALNPSTHRLHLAFHFLLYRLSLHKDLALPLPKILSPAPTGPGPLRPPGARRPSGGPAAANHRGSEPPAPVSTGPETVRSSGTASSASASASGPSVAAAGGRTLARAKPTLSGQVRHYKLSQLVLLLDKVIVVQEQLFRRLERQASCSEWVQDSLQHLLRVLEKESDRTLALAQDLPVNEEGRHHTETTINALIDALAEMLAAFGAVARAWEGVVGRAAASASAEMASSEAAASPWPNGDAVEALLDGLPERYTVTDYADLFKSFDAEPEWN